MPARWLIDRTAVLLLTPRELCLLPRKSLQLSQCHVCSLLLGLQTGPWENTVPQSWLSSAALCVMVVLGEGMCDVYYMQIFYTDSQFLSLKRLLSNHPAQMRCFFISIVTCYKWL